ncbi:acyl-CoA synthetase (AMP-forming)/AMP-acid ligase II [Pseudomonas chlororaphis subsp. aurantiaca]|uniref:AMP-binding protein n=1 Tax=Pseudomonas chlororaphis TaxID=587753 RepID=UPI00086670AA|nr:AMP-binding protein [Pseudomonas chlororaphis]BAV75627.1 acyl-CoA synthetase (AMP-forming)/AMP-acid ligase II [Pseudomonas chlororaphis subsp. aurantiaca]
MQTINHRFSHAITQGDAIWTFADTNRSYTIAEIGVFVDTCTAKLSSLGLQQQDRVGLVLNNSIELVGYLLACWRLNLVAVPLRTKSGKYLNYADFLASCDASCSFKLVLCDAAITPQDIELWRTRTGLEIYSEPDFNPQSEQALPAPAEIRPDDMAIIQFSSGSTGFPKGIIVTHTMVMNQLRHIEHSHRASRHGVGLHNSASWTPIHHDLGLFTGVLLPLYSACNHLLATPEYFMRNPARWFKLLSEHQVDMSFITNSALVAALRTVKRLYGDEQMDLSRLHLYIAAEKISALVLRKVKERFAPVKLLTEHIHSAYGMAENSLGASCSKLGELKTLTVTIDSNGNVQLATSEDEGSIELVSSGQANARHSITVRDAADQPLPELKLGEINIESDCLTPGYLNMPQATQAKLGTGRLRTGDLGFFHEQELYFYSRQDDLIVIGGRNIIPDDIEETVESFDFVRASGSALLSMENSATGLMELHLVLEGDANDSGSELAQKQKTLTLAVLDTHDALLSRVHFCPRGSIEKTSSGKKRRRVIRQRLIDKQLVAFPAPQPCA